MSPSKAFRIHYTTTGDSAVPVADSDGDSVPDWVENAAIIADSVLDRYGAMGYDTTLVDRNVDGGSEFDIYFMRIPYYGLTYNGSDPFIVLHRSFADRGFATHGLDALRVTIAHEMFHAIQNRYTNGASSTSWYWWREMSATFMEDLLYDNVNDFHQYLNPSIWSLPVLYERPDLGIDHFEYWSVYPYGGAVFLRFLWEKYGDAALVFLRETTAERSYVATAIVSDLERRLGDPAEDILADFWTWNYFTGGRFRTGFYTEGNLYKPAPLESPYPDVAVSSIASRSMFADTATVTRLGAHLLRIPPDRTNAQVSVSVTGVGQSADRWAWRLAVSLPETVQVISGVPSITGGADDVRFVIPAAMWARAIDVVLVAANGSVPAGGTAYRYEVTYGMPTAIAATKALPSRTTLGMPSPNPFNAQVAIPVDLDRPQDVSLVVYDANGRPVRTILAGKSLPAGRHDLAWDGKSDVGRSVGSGVYILRLDANGATTVRRISLLR